MVFYLFVTGKTKDIDGILLFLVGSEDSNKAGNVLLLEFPNECWALRW